MILQGKGSAEWLHDVKFVINDPVGNVEGKIIQKWTRTFACCAQGFGAGAVTRTLGQFRVPAPGHNIFLTAN